jgi:hypothetical protein
MEKLREVERSWSSNFSLRTCHTCTVKQLIVSRMSNQLSAYRFSYHVTESKGAIARAAGAVKRKRRRQGCEEDLSVEIRFHYFLSPPSSFFLPPPSYNPTRDTIILISYGEADSSPTLPSARNVEVSTSYAPKQDPAQPDNPAD